IEDARQAEREERDRLATLRENLPGVLERIGVPFAWRDARFQGCIDLPSNLVDRARTWAAQPAGMLLLCGAAGSGKTFVAVSILAEVLAAGLMYPEKAAFVGERELLDGVKAGFNGDGPGRESELMRRAKAAELLVLDDLASTRLTSWGAAEVAGVIEQRFARGLALVVTSNLDLPGLADTIDPRVTSRLGAFGNAWSFPAKDLRMAGRIKSVFRRLGGPHALSLDQRRS
ncbi:MAG TPA: ATP-binding protein, partial [Phycisphaerae bacterium]|nr:ATP-binding protein [Phycisphaerae bacterium]